MLQGKRIALPESRELDLFAQMIEREGGVAARRPLVSIFDVDDPAPVDAWLRRFIDAPPDYLVLYTGEGLSRLLGFARRVDLADRMVAALGAVCKIVRGPKPAKVLRGVGLKWDMMAEEPTTAGLVAMLERLDLRGRRVGVQVYPGGEHALDDVLERAGAAADPVLCYRYAAQEEDQQTLRFIDELASGAFDAIAFTSTPQIRRLRDVAQRAGRLEDLNAVMQRVVIAAIGPVTADAVTAAGWRVAATPEQSFHLKPLVAALSASLDMSGK
ncbi:MAG: uroporphyrinogen synthase [Hyphomicrobiales bacterium]|nr:uroporphyrinogen synthase [Hyphomicrobiales bacterium]